MEHRNREFSVYITDTDELIPTERIALVAFALADDKRLTVEDVARMIGITHRGAHYMLNKMIRVVPGLTEVDGVYFRMRN